MRRDKRGRRIGYNWWREFITSEFFLATAVWESQCEAAAMGYPTETAEFAAENPRPTLKALLLGHKGMNQPRGDEPSV